MSLQSLSDFSPRRICWQQNTTQWHCMAWTIACVINSSVFFLHFRSFRWLNVDVCLQAFGSKATCCIMPAGGTLLEFQKELHSVCYQRHRLELNATKTSGSVVVNRSSPALYMNSSSLLTTSSLRGRVSKFPKSYVPKVLCSQCPMFLGTHES